MAEDLRMAAARFDQTQQHLDGCAFACAVGPEEAEDFSATHLQRETTNGNLRAEGLAKAVRFDGQLISRRQWLLRYSRELANSTAELASPWPARP